MASTKKKEVPLSEDLGKYRPDFKKADCIDELRRIAEIDPEVYVTRNYFRNHSRISESTWNRFFGTFDEFKRQAGITPSRHARRMEKDIAKHASVEAFKAMNVEKSGWEGKYLRPTGSRWKTVVTATDIHDIECDPFWELCFLDTLKRAQPDVIVLGGDVYDLPEFGKFSVDPREWDVVGRIKWVHGFLDRIRAVCPNAEIHFVEGNHEYRLLRHLAEASPAMRAVLGDLHGFTVPKLLGLDAYEINYVARADLATFTASEAKHELARNYLILFDCFMVNHFPEGRTMGMPGVNGHHHRHFCWQMFNPTYKAYEWHQLGTAHKRRASYTDGEKWGNGFGIEHIDTVTKSVLQEYVDIRDHAVIGGKWYFREPVKKTA